jgi:hypothetical protein
MNTINNPYNICNSINNIEWNMVGENTSGLIIAWINGSMYATINKAVAISPIISHILLDLFIFEVAIQLFEN